MFEKKEISKGRRVGIGRGKDIRGGRRVGREKGGKGGGE